MYCPKCKIETGNDNFCENCGGATINKSDLSGDIKEKEVSQSPKEKFEDKKVTLSNLDSKKIIKISICAIVVISILVGYNTLSKQYTPKSTVDKYYSYLLSKDYNKAYKMLNGVDNQFLSEDDFERYVENLELDSYSIKDYDSNSFSTLNTNASGSMFSVQTNKGLIPIEVQKDGKKLLVFNNYKINVNEFATKWEFEAPKGAKITVNDKEVNYDSDTIGDSMMSSLGSNYNTTKSKYVINSIFNGPYDVTATMEGAKDYNLSGAIAGKLLNIKFEPSDELSNELKELAKRYLDLKCSNATDDKYSSLLTQDSTILEKTNQFYTSSTSTTTNKLQDIKITKQSIDDSEHAKISIKGTMNYEEDPESPVVKWGIIESKGTKDITADFYFEKSNGKWLISDTNYLN